MAVHISEYYNISHSKFESLGVLDSYVDRDMNLHIDPLRLRDTKIQEFKDSYKNTFLKYFERFVLFVDNMTDSNKKMMFNLIVEHLQFKEIPNVGLGYSETGKPGKGMSGKIARQVAGSIVEIIKAGLKEPELFAFMHLFEKNIGADRISDMSIFILRHQILSYTQHMAEYIGIPVQEFQYEQNTYLVPFYKDNPIHLFPIDLLADLPMAASYDDIDAVCNYNRGLIQKVCAAVNGNLKDFIEGKNTKENFRNAILYNKIAYDEAIGYIRGLSARSYDFLEDKKRFYFEVRRKELLESIIKELNFRKKLTADDVLEISRNACLLFKKCIENHRSYKLMYYEKGNLAKSEKAAQELLYIVSVAYLKASGADVDISPEADTGVGKLDFKFSQGASSRVIIEMKLSNNRDLLNGYVTQLPEYMKSQNAVYGIYVVVIVDSKGNQNKFLNQLREIEENRSKDDKLSPIIIFVDARERTTASKM